ncbi:MAG: glucose/sorbosone dehydrogenase, partial [Acidobacteria bacterium]|nr:glucose/sorbosone dehydrogenase [Acidobacteriota bacterium]
RESFLVALHGSSVARLGRGYRVAQLRRGAPPVDFITGFARRGRVFGRPADVLRVAPDAFFLTDDHAGVIYYVAREQ